MACKLCGREAVLRNSHIIPEFLYTPLYDELHRLHEHDRESGGVKFAQKGHREPLLCDDCERLLNDRYEKYFKRVWYDEGKLPARPEFDRSVIEGLDYSRFKLFLLSVLWRASVAQQDLFARVALGPKHEPALRKMVLTGDPGPEELYPIAVDVLWLKDYVVRGAVMQPVDRKHGHQRVYIFVFGGCAWFFLVGTEESGMFRTLTLRRDGRLPIMWEELTKMPMVQEFLVHHLSARARRN